METTSSLKMKLVKMKSALFSFTTSQKEKDCKMIQELAFNSTFEQNIFAALRGKSWEIGITVGVTSVTVDIIQLMIVL